MPQHISINCFHFFGFSHKQVLQLAMSTLCVQFLNNAFQWACFNIFRAIHKLEIKVFIFQDYKFVYRQQRMKVKINKILPEKDLVVSKIKTQELTIGKQRYGIAPYKIDQNNFTGFPIYLQLICTLPDATVEYEYVKFMIVAESSDYKQVIERKVQRFDDIKKGQQRRDFVFSFVPMKKGVYMVKLDATYRPRYFTNNNQQLDQRKQSMQTSLKFQQPLQLTEFFVTQDKVNSIAFPLLIQHSIQSKYPDVYLDFSVSFQSEKFFSKFMNDKTQFKLRINQTYSTVLSVKPQNIKQFLQEKPQTIGELIIKYGDKGGQIRKKVNFRVNDKYLFFKGFTMQKTIPKKDIVEVVVKFEKVYNANFGLGDLSIVINQNLMEGIKIVKTSKSKINLDQNRFQDVIFSVICLKSGFYHVKGLTLNTTDNRIVNYVNDITLFVQNQRDHKLPVFQNTTVIQIPMEDSLI